MKNRIMKTVNKALALTLIAAILSTGGLAVHLAHVNATVTISFGDIQPANVALADVMDMSALTPLPVRKPKVR